MPATTGFATALTFVWLGMVVAISFVEAPLKFRAPGVTLQVGLGIGRLVFRALNTAEVVLGVAVAIALLLGDPPGLAVTALVIAGLALIVQLAGVRPQLTKRSDAVLAAGPGGAPPSRSRAHYAYVALELVKVVSLVVAGIVLLGG
ncbi:hypothetical protein L2K20_19740 [Mycobacterium sp. MBM]|nr:hypothetical protein [Mycobacterium sp. MBM]